MDLKWVNSRYTGAATIRVIKEHAGATQHLRVRVFDANGAQLFPDPRLPANMEWVEELPWYDIEADRCREPVKVCAYDGDDAVWIDSEEERPISEYLQELVDLYEVPEKFPIMEGLVIDLNEA